MCLPTRSPSRVETGEGRAGGRQWRRRASIHRPAKALPYLPFAADDGWPHLSVACCACSFIPCAGRLNYLHVASETCCCCAPDATSFTRRSCIWASLVALATASDYLTQGTVASREKLKISAHNRFACFRFILRLEMRNSFML